MYSPSNTISLLSCNFNTSELTNIMVESLISAFPIFPVSSIFILDNSDKTVYEPGRYNVNVIDNTFYKHTPKYKYPSQSHSAALSWCLDNVLTSKYVIICDNDIKFHSNISEFIRKGLSTDCIGEIGYDTVPPNRLFPYLLMFDLEKYKREGLSFFDLNRCIVHVSKTHETLSSKYGNCYDTGYSFYMDILERHWRITNVNINDYMTHLKSGSYSLKSWASD